MKTLHLHSSIRKGSSNKTERQYLDFFVLGESLKQILAIASADYITLLDDEGDENYRRHIVNVYRLTEKSQTSSGRIMIYVCPECGDINCGSITARIEDLGDRIVWKDFGYETDYGGVTKEYSDIEPIEFERQSYFSEFSKLT